MSTNPSQYQVYHNTISEGEIILNEIIRHDEYNEELLIQNDICILKAEPFVINESVQPACLGTFLKYDNYMMPYGP